MALEPVESTIANDVQQPAASGPKGGSILLIVVVLLPVLLLTGALGWLWNESAHRSSAGITGAP